MERRGRHWGRRSTAAAAAAAGLALAAARVGAEETAPPPGPPPKPQWEGAFGPVLNVSPEYTGGAREKVSVVPGFFLRYGRLSVSNTGAFVTRRSDDVFRGLGADLHLTDTVRTNMALRLDNGRSSSSSAALNGLQDVRRTVRASFSATWRPVGDHPMAGWHATAALGVDLLGRGGGQTAGFSLFRDVGLGPRFTWSYGASLAAANGQYMRGYYGVTPEESARTAYPVYRPGAGFQDASLGTGWRLEFEEQRWVAFWGGGVGRLLGPAAASPITAKPVHWSVNGGIARRF